LEALKIEDLSKNFGGLKAVDRLSFQVTVGERLGIIGPNGAGKTTLFNLLNGQLFPTGGRISLFEKEITNFPPNRRAHLGISRSFQISRLFYRLTVLENCQLALMGVQPIRYQMFRSTNHYHHLLEKAQELLAPVALWEMRNESVKNMSYGDQRRLEIVLSLASKPRVLLMDEPTAGLTSAEGAKIIEMMGKLGKDISVLIIAHDMDLVFGVAERILVLHYGKIITEGKPEEMKKDPKVKEIYMGLGEHPGDA
jgi:branched-chain amino acid transport system ATP-binding protein